MKSRVSNGALSTRQLVSPTDTVLARIMEGIFRPGHLSKKSRPKSTGEGREKAREHMPMKTFKGAPHNSLVSTLAMHSLLFSTARGALFLCDDRI